MSHYCLGYVFFFIYVLYLLLLSGREVRTWLRKTSRTRLLHYTHPSCCE